MKITALRSSEGSLLQAFNEMALERQDRKYRKWKIDGSNNGTRYLNDPTDNGLPCSLI